MYRKCLLRIEINMNKYYRRKVNKMKVRGKKNISCKYVDNLPQGTGGIFNFVFWRFVYV